MTGPEPARNPHAPAPAPAAAPAPAPDEEAGNAWRGLYRAGGTAALVFVALLIAALVIDFIAPPPVHGSAATLEFIASNKVLYITEQLLWILPGILPVIVFVALFVALAPVSRSLALLAAVVGGLPWARLLAVSLVMLKGVLPRAVAWLGLLTGGLGVVSEALRFAVPEFYWVYGVLLWAWFTAVGVGLIRLRPASAKP